MISELAATEAVTAFYRVILMREPDPSGLENHVAQLTNGARTLEDTLASFLQSEEFRRLAQQGLENHGAVAQPRFTNDTTQFGEFGILMRLWVNEASKHRIVVDVGARGKERSNSYDLMKVFGWRGILIEANPALIPAIQAEFQGLDFELLNCAVSNYDGVATLHIGANDDVSSLDIAAAQGWGDLRGEATVEVKRLAPILQQRNVPPDFDLLSLDIEGEDIRVLNDLIDEQHYRPTWVIIEASYDYSVSSLFDRDFSNEVRKRYKIVGQTSANLILRSQ